MKKKSEILFTLLKSSAISLFFLSISVLNHLYFLLSNNKFTGMGDALSQFGFFQYLLYKLYSQGDFFWSWKYGLGGDIWGQFGYYYSSNLFFLITLFIRKLTFIELYDVKLLISVVKCFLAMLFMYFCLRSNRKKTLSCIAGAVIYGGSITFIRHAMLFDFMTNAIVYLPLLVWGFERYLEKNKKGLFILSLFLILFENFYFAFISSNFLFIYSFIRYFSLERIHSILDIIKYYSRIAVMYLCALLMSAAAFLPSVYAVFNSDRLESNSKIPLFFEYSFYKGTINGLFFIDDPSYQLGICIVLVYLLIISFSLKQKMIKNKIVLFFVMFGLFLLPFSYSYFNGMSAQQSRWLYLFAFCCAQLAAFVIDEFENNAIPKIPIIFSFFLITIMIKLKKEILQSFIAYSDLVILSFAAIFLILLLIKNKLPFKIFNISLIFLISLHVIYVNNEYSMKILKNHYLQKLSTEKSLQTSGFQNEHEMNLINSITDNDKDFYRIMYNKLPTQNTPMLYWYNGVSAYQSLISRNIHQFITKHYAISQQYDPVSKIVTLDNRLFIETVLGVKYYFCKDDDYKPYGYDLIYDSKQYKIYKNRLSLPIGFMYYDGINKKMFDQLHASQKDQLLLKAAVVDDLSAANLNPFTEINKGSKKVKIDGKIELKNANWTGQHLIVKNNGLIKIPIEKLEEAGELLLEIKIAHAKGAPFSLKINQQSFQKQALDSTYAYPVDKIVFNLSKNSPHPNEIIMTLTPGEYQIQDFGVYLSMYNNIAKEVQKLKIHALEQVQYTEQSVQGVISTKKDGLLYLSIPYSKGWTVKVDGKKTKFIEVNHAFIGVALNKGIHKVELNYITPYFKEGLFISLIGLVTFLVICYQNNLKIKENFK